MREYRKILRNREARIVRRLHRKQWCSQVHCLDRDAGTTDPLDAPTGLTALDPTQRARKAAKKTVITYQMPQGVEHQKAALASVRGAD